MKTMRVYQHRGSLQECLATEEVIPATTQALHDWVVGHLRDWDIPAGEIDMTPPVLDNRLGQWRRVITVDGSAMFWLHSEDERSPMEESA